MLRKSIIFTFFSKELIFYYMFGDLTFLGWFFEVFIYNTNLNINNILNSINGVINIQKNEKSIDLLEHFRA